MFLCWFVFASQRIVRCIQRLPSVIVMFVDLKSIHGARAYDPISAKLPSLKEKYKSDEEKLRDIACREVEIDMFRKYSEVYGYVFYVVQCSTRPNI